MRKSLAMSGVAAGLVFVLTSCSLVMNKANTYPDGTAAEWDVSTPVSASALTGGDDGIAILETPGSDGINLTLTLPDGETLQHNWGLVTARDGMNGSVEEIELTLGPNTNRDLWQPRVDAFIAEFGSDRYNITEWIEDSLVHLRYFKDSNAQRNFDGEPRDSYLPAMSIRMAGGGQYPIDVRVEWAFTLDM
jgi:hypothetical protein